MLTNIGIVLLSIANWLGLGLALLRSGLCLRAGCMNVP